MRDLIIGTKYSVRQTCEYCNDFKKIRELKGWNLEEAAAKLKINVEKLDKLEKGHKYMHFQVFLRFCRIYNVKLKIELVPQ